MDKIISRTNKRKHKVILLSIVLLTSVSIFAFTNYSSAFSKSISIASEKLMVSTVEEGLFEDYINLTALIEPSDVYYLDASESGRIEQIYVESGDSLKVGDTLLLLTNSELQLEVMQREAQLLEQYNNQQQTQILLERSEIEQQGQLAESEYNLKVISAQYERAKILFEDSVIAPAEYEPIAAEYNYALNRSSILKRTYASSSKSRKAQLIQINQAIDRIGKSLEGVRRIIDGLVIKAPTGGKLSDFTLKQGETIDRGDDIGQIYTFRKIIIRAEVDEFYLGKLTKNVKGIASYRNKSYPINLEKIYPTVEEGKFKIDCVFAEEVPLDISKGSSARLQLNLSESFNSVLLPRGEYYNQTGGEWIFVKREDKAERINIKLGRSNPNYYEVIEGLQAGEQVIISSYEGLENFNTININ